ncbi:MAG: hypothetical protein CW742_00535 [Methanoregula sp.]|nr:MAG: hypothetical protein CW742_00535 [Methanoregula sp.]
MLHQISRDFSATPKQHGTVNGNAARVQYILQPVLPARDMRIRSVVGLSGDVVGYFPGNTR